MYVGFLTAALMAPFFSPSCLYTLACPRRSHAIRAELHKHGVYVYGGQVLDESPVTFLPLPVIKPSWDDLLQVDTAEPMKKQFDGRTVLYTTSTVLDKLKFNRC